MTVDGLQKLAAFLGTTLVGHKKSDKAKNIIKDIENIMNKVQMLEEKVIKLKEKNKKLKEENKELKDTSPLATWYDDNETTWHTALIMPAGMSGVGWHHYRKALQEGFEHLVEDMKETDWEAKGNDDDDHEPDDGPQPDGGGFIAGATLILTTSPPLARLISEAVIGPVIGSMPSIIRLFPLLLFI